VGCEDVVVERSEKVIVNDVVVDCDERKTHLHRTLNTQRN
jgi:hypothetical protein